VKTPIHNFKRQEKRRVVFNVRLDYKTPPEFLREVPTILKNIISNREQVTFDRAHLQALADYYINYEVVYTLSTADYNFYMDLHQDICLQLIDTFKNKGIDFAIPNQIVRLDRIGEKEKKSDTTTEIVTS
jgi:small-conductance mechanosensitive channel